MLAADETMCSETKGALTYVFRGATKETIKFQQVTLIDSTISGWC